MMVDKTDVIVVGAGPVGLLSAINLAKNGVKVRMLERNEKKSPFSKAIAIHPGTLEYFDAVIPDLIPSFLKHGKQAGAIN
jgi:2-polyprenyl-6-methoxyphenol hydroxylase-like FAD-dependent oxidoreductase